MSTSLNLREYVPTSSPCSSLAKVIVISSVPINVAFAEITVGLGSLNALLNPTRPASGKSLNDIVLAAFVITTAFVPFVRFTDVYVALSAEFARLALIV